jgi:MerR family transcriptional regulator, heat shock protein HspR
VTGGRGPGDGSPIPGLPSWADEDTPVFVISIAAEFSGMHAQTLRSYDRIGLVRPGRASGGGRRYSVRDIALLREVQRLSQEEGVNLAGIKRIIELEREVGALTDRLAEVTEELTRWRAAAEQAARNSADRGADGGNDRLPARRTQSVVVWQPGPRRRD